MNRHSAPLVGKPLHLPLKVATMLGSSMLDIAIGVVFIYLLLSVFATAINEVVVSALSLRGKFLLQGIKTLLNDDHLDGFARKVYEHGQVYGLYDGPFNSNKPKNLPSYIPSRNFALALINCVEHHATAAPPANPAQAGEAEAQHLENQANTDPNQNPQPVVPAALPISLAAATTQAATAAQSVVLVSQLFRDAASELAQSPDTEKIGKPLVAMIESAGGELAKLQQGIENWYNSGMDRVSGKYKYYTQGILLAIGLVIAISLNADTISIVQHLSKDSTLRQSIIAAAQSAKDPAPKPAPPPQTAPAATDAAPATQATITADTKTSDDGGLSARIAAANNSFKTIEGLGIPLGWPASGHPAESVPSKLGYALHWIIFENPSMIFGWLFTAIAISLGAPFWFDTLNKIMIVRSTVKPSEKSPDEKSKS